MAKNSNKPIDKEAVRILAIEIGAREAARKLGLNEDTVCSWSKRGNWKLPKRNGELKRASMQAVASNENVGDVVLNTLKVREENTRSQLAIVAERGATEAAQLEAVLPAAPLIASLVSAIGKTFGWASGGQPSVNYYGDVNTVVVCDEAKRKQLIEQRERLLQQEAIDV